MLAYGRIQVIARRMYVPIYGQSRGLDVTFASALHRQHGNNMETTYLRNTKTIRKQHYYIRKIVCNMETTWKQYVCNIFSVCNMETICLQRTSPSTTWRQHVCIIFGFLQYEDNTFATCFVFCNMKTTCLPQFICLLGLHQYVSNTVCNFWCTDIQVVSCLVQLSFAFFWFLWERGKAPFQKMGVLQHNKYLNPLTSVV